MAKDEWSEDMRRAVASQFFTLFGKLSLERMSARTGGRIAKQTVARDREKLRKRQAPTQSSAESYAAAIGRPEGYDFGNPAEMDEFFAALTAARREYYDAAPIREHVTGVRHKSPKMWNLLHKRIGERKWESVIDVLETFFYSSDAENYKDSEAYMLFYMGMAYNNLGDPEMAAKQYAAAYNLIKTSNSETALKSHTAVDYALALQARPQSIPDRKLVPDLLTVALDNLPSDYAPALVNILIAASRLSDEWFGSFSGRIRDKLLDPGLDLDWTALRSMFKEQDELSDYHHDDMFQQVMDAIQVRIGQSAKEKKI